MKRKILIIGIVLTIASAGLFMAFSKGEDTENLQRVKSYKVEKKDIQRKVRVKGVVEAKEIKKVYISSPQKVEKVNFKTGDKVEAGDIIIRFDPEMKNNLEREILSLSIDIDNEKIRLSELESPSSDFELIEAKNNLEDMKTQEKQMKSLLNITKEDLKNTLLTKENMEKTIESNLRLLEIGGISQKEYDKLLEEKRNLNTEIDKKRYDIADYESKVKSYENKIMIAEKNYNHTKLQNQNQIKLTKNTIKKYELSMLTKKEELNKLVNNIVSPFSSTILSMEAEDNYTVNIENGKPLITLADISSQLIKTEIPAYDISKVKKGQKVQIKSSSIEGIDFKGNVTKISSIAQLKESGNVSEKVVYAEVTPQDKNDILKPGFDVDLEIIVDSKEEANVIPNISIVYEGTDTYVYVINTDNTLEKRQVTLGVEDVMETEVIGLSKGESIVANPNPELSDGMDVTLEENSDDQA